MEDKDYVVYGKYPKCKYTLYVTSCVPYSMVTTARSEQECINILRSKTEYYRAKDRKTYKITKKINGEEILLEKGFIAGFY